MALGLPLIGVVVLALGIGLSGALTSSRTSGDQPIPPPTPGASTSGTGVVPGSGRATYFVLPPEFAGKVVHLVGTSYGYGEGAPDPANGRPHSFDAWVRIGTNGKADLFHLVSTYEDGSFHQEILTTPSDEIVVSEPSAAIKAPNGPPVCLVKGVGSPALLESRVPDFVDETALARASFQLQGTVPPSRTAQTATRTPVPGALIVTPPDSQVRRFTRQASGPSNGKSTATLEIGSNGRVQVNQMQTTDGQGRIVSENWTANGTLEVFDPASAPPDAFALTREVCDG